MLGLPRYTDRIAIGVRAWIILSICLGNTSPPLCFGKYTYFLQLALDNLGDFDLGSVRVQLFHVNMI